MPFFSKNSKEKLRSCDPLIQDVLNDAIKHYDFSVVDGHRDMARQNQYFNEGTSKLRWPDSRHNSFPSLAVDIIPYPSQYSDEQEFYTMATYVLASANRLGVRLDWGGHWQTFKDLPHFELKD